MQRMSSCAKTRSLANFLLRLDLKHHTATLSARTTKVARRYIAAIDCRPEDIPCRIDHEAVVGRLTAVSQAAESIKNTFSEGSVGMRRELEDNSAAERHAASNATPETCSSA